MPIHVGVVEQPPVAYTLALRTSAAEAVHAGLRLQTTGGQNRAAWSSAAAMTLALDPTVTSFTWSHTQAAAGAGGASSFSAQRGAAGSIGGALTLASGQGGTLGVNQAGPLVLDIGQTTAGGTAPLRIDAGATGTIETITLTSGNIVLHSAGARELRVESSIASTPTAAIFTISGSGGPIGAQWRFGLETAAGVQSAGNLWLYSAWDEFNLYLDTDNSAVTGRFQIFNDVSPGAGTAIIILDAANARAEVNELRSRSGTVLTLRTINSTDTIALNLGGTALGAYSLAGAEVRFDLNAARTGLSFRAAGAGQYVALTAGTGGGGIILATGTSVNMRDTPGTTTYWTWTAAAANTLVLSASVTSFAWTWTQSAGAGGLWSLTGQQGANGSAGGGITLTAGSAGTTGTRSQGGALLLIAGAANGNAGASVNGANATLRAGAGSGGGSTGGSVRLQNGAGTSLFEISDTTIAFFNGTLRAQAANIGAITDNSTGTPANQVVDAGLVYSQANINNNFATVVQRLNRIDALLNATTGYALTA